MLGDELTVLELWPAGGESVREAQEAIRVCVGKLVLRVAATQTTFISGSGLNQVCVLMVLQKHKANWGDLICLPGLI